MSIEELKEFIKSELRTYRNQKAYVESNIRYLEMSLRDIEENGENAEIFKDNHRMDVLLHSFQVDFTLKAQRNLREKE